MGLFLVVRRKYLSDPIEEVRIATENLLADFLHEIRDVTYVARHLDEHGPVRRPEDDLGRTDSTESRGIVATEDYDGTVVDIAESPVEINGSGEDEESGSPERDDRRAGGISLLRPLRFLLTLG